MHKIALTNALARRSIRGSRRVGECGVCSELRNTSVTNRLGTKMTMGNRGWVVTVFVLTT